MTLRARSHKKKSHKTCNLEQHSRWIFQKSLFFTFWAYCKAGACDHATIVTHNGNLFLRSGLPFFFKPRGPQMNPNDFHVHVIETVTLSSRFVPMSSLRREMQIMRAPPCDFEFADQMSHFFHCVSSVQINSHCCCQITFPEKNNFMHSRRIHSRDSVVFFCCIHSLSHCC